MPPLVRRAGTWPAVARDSADRAAGIARELRAASAAYRSPLYRVVGRAAHLWRRGWYLGDAAYMGLLDPVHGPALERVAACPSDLTRLQERLNPPAAVPTAEDKRLFAEICAREGLPAPALAAVLERHAGRAETVRAWAAILHRDAPEEAVVKPAEGHRGIGVRVLRRRPDGVEDHNARPMSWTTLAAALAAERWQAFIVQPRLRPHGALRALSGRDVLQTMRVVTLRDDAGGVRILLTLLRIAVGAEAVDSFRSGATRNALAVVSPDGVTTATYRVAESGFGMEPMPVHPVTGEATVGFAVPEWDAVRALVDRAAGVFAPLRAVGWDVAVTDDGPVLVEANAWWAVASTPAGDTLPVLAALRDAVRPLAAAQGS
jgi:hypothetical protein